MSSCRGGSQPTARRYREQEDAEGNVAQVGFACDEVRWCPTCAWKRARELAEGIAATLGADGRERWCVGALTVHISGTLADAVRGGTRVGSRLSTKRTTVGVPALKLIGRGWVRPEAQPDGSVRWVLPVVVLYFAETEDVLADLEAHVFGKLLPGLPEATPVEDGLVRLTPAGAAQLVQRVVEAIPDYAGADAAMVKADRAAYQTENGAGVHLFDKNKPLREVWVEPEDAEAPEEGHTLRDVLDLDACESAAERVPHEVHAEASSWLKNGREYYGESRKPSIWEPVGRSGGVDLAPDDAEQWARELVDRCAPGQRQWVTGDKDPPPGDRPTLGRIAEAFRVRKRPWREPVTVYTLSLEAKDRGDSVTQVSHSLFSRTRT